MKIKEVTTASTDVLSMYHSIKFPLVKKSISFFTVNLVKNQPYTIKLCLKTIAFGMRSTLLTFGDIYFEYGERCIEKKGLVIGGYSSDFIVDLLSSYLFEKCNNQLKEVLWKFIYIDDGF